MTVTSRSVDGSHALRAILAGTDRRLRSIWLEIWHHWRWWRSPISRITLRFVRRHGKTVQGGPFKGMQFPRSAITRSEALVSRLLGAYELELHPALERLRGAHFDQIVDIGAAEGYYAVGLALAHPDATVIAWEMKPLAARVCRAMAKANGVEDRLVLGGECRIDDLRRLPDSGRTFVLCDCEGCEASLLRPDEVPILRRATVIVELHDSLVPGVTEAIKERFAPTHLIELVSSQPRYLAEFPTLMKTPATHYMERYIALSEFRPVAMRWAVMWPKDTR